MRATPPWGRFLLLLFFYLSSAFLYYLLLFLLTAFSCTSRDSSPSPPWKSSPSMGDALFLPTRTTPALLGLPSRSILSGDVRRTFFPTPCVLRVPTVIRLPAAGVPGAGTLSDTVRGEPPARHREKRILQIAEPKKYLCTFTTVELLSLIHI